MIRKYTMVHARTEIYLSIASVHPAFPFDISRVEETLPKEPTPRMRPRDKS